MHIPTITREELRTWLDDKRDFVLLDTALADDFRAEHLPGAQNACVYEVNFLDQAQKLAGIQASPLARAVGAGAHQEATIVTYGASARSLASTTAAEKLTTAGFMHVHDFRGGMEDWRAAGFATERDATAVKKLPGVEDRTYGIDLKESIVEWTGRSLVGGKHQGTINVTAGEITIQGGRAVGGRFTLDMTSVANTDLVNPLMRTALLKHLASDDFFDVERYPEAHFFLDCIAPVPDATPGRPDHRVSGRLLLKAIEQPLEFSALIGPSADGDGSLVARANFDLDRTRWNVLYGSGKFYEGLGKHLVNDLVTLDLKITAR